MDIRSSGYSNCDFFVDSLSYIKANQSTFHLSSLLRVKDERYPQHPFQIWKIYQGNGNIVCRDCDQSCHY